MSKYLKEEHDKLKKKFKDRFNRCFDRHTKQYITKYEGIDYDNEFDSESIDNVIKTFMIDIKSPLVSLTQE